MKKKEKAKTETQPTKQAAPLVGDLFRDGSKIAKVYTLLSDGKPHSKQETAACVGVEGRWPHVFSTLIRRGESSGKFSVTVEGDSATLTFDKPKPKSKKNGGSHAKQNAEA